MLTLTGLSGNDANNDGKFEAGDTLTLNAIDPASPNVTTVLTISPGDPMTIKGGAYDGYQLNGALSESPVIPEPSSLILLSVAAVVGVGSVYRKRLARAA